jgi:hypothetical protein
MRERGEAIKRPRSPPPPRVVGLGTLGDVFVLVSDSPSVVSCHATRVLKPGMSSPVQIN